MEIKSFDLEFEIARFHWWFVGRRRLLGYLLSSFGLLRHGLILDIGCGVGSNFYLFDSLRIRVVGLDRSFYALSLASRKFKNPLINGDLNKLPLKKNSIGVIIASDILEHLENDLTGIKELYQSLMKNGILIMTVPAFRFLRGTQDVVTGHKRRYSREEIVHKLREEGFQILRTSYFNFFLFLPILLTRLLIRLLGLQLESENKVNSPLVNFLLKTIFLSEVHFLKYLSFPFGVSIFCVAQK